jgi:ABC-type lipoprotein export system ATPase subunit
MQTIVMVTHEDWHAAYADRVIRLRDGVVVEQTPQQKEPQLNTKTNVQGS